MVIVVKVDHRASSVVDRYLQLNVPIRNVHNRYILGCSCFLAPLIYVIDADRWASNLIITWADGHSFAPFADRYSRGNWLVFSWPRSALYRGWYRKIAIDTLTMLCWMQLWNVYSYALVPLSVVVSGHNLDFGSAAVL